MYQNNLYIEYKNSETSVDEVNGNIIKIIEPTDDVKTKNNKIYGYIKIDYTFDMTTSSFNISTQHRPNVPINYVITKDGIPVDVFTNDNNSLNNIKSLFKKIYPYMKVDLLMDNYFQLKDIIVFPTYVTSKINKVSNKISKLNLSNSHIYVLN